MAEDFESQFLDGSDPIYAIGATRVDKNGRIEAQLHPVVGYDPALLNGDNSAAVTGWLRIDGAVEILDVNTLLNPTSPKNSPQVSLPGGWDIYGNDYSTYNKELIEKFQSVKPEFIGSSTDKHPLHTGVGYSNSEQAEVPDCVMTLTGYRVWWPYDILSSKYFRDGLTSIAYNEYKLTPAKAEKANCLDYWDDSGKDKVCPDENCFCGYYSFKSLDVLLHQSVELMPRVVIGIVDVWGKVIEHELGYRSQYIYPRELWLLSPDQEYLGEMYGVPVRKAY